MAVFRLFNRQPAMLHSGKKKGRDLPDLLYLILIGYLLCQVIRQSKASSPSVPKHPVPGMILLALLFDNLVMLFILRSQM
jgi:hypothetical protein